MGIDPAMQGLQALLSLACGTALGFLYDLMTALLRRSRLEKLLILFYLPYSLLAAVLLFLLGSIAGRGGGAAVHAAGDAAGRPPLSASLPPGGTASGGGDRLPFRVFLPDTPQTPGFFVENFKEIFDFCKKVLFFRKRMG